jgi:hypothetical protein
LLRLAHLDDNPLHKRRLVNSLRDFLNGPRKAPVKDEIR